MAELTVEVHVSKEAYELGQALVAIAAAVKTALADGWQAGDIPEVVATCVNVLGNAVDGFSKLPDEAKNDTVAFSKALGLSVSDLASLFVK